MNKHKLSALAAIITLLGTPLLAAAQTSTTPTVGTSSTVTSKLVGQFSSFTGSTENANALVNGLRTGSSITLTSPATAPAGTTGGGVTSLPTSTTFTSPTKPMGYGNVKIAMSLAQADLASQGITNPTPQQLQGSLMGTNSTSNGVTTQTQGILQMRADGMGWGKIANTMGFKLGAVMSGRAIPANANSGMAASTAHGKPVTTGTSGASGSSHGKGIVTAASGTGNASHGNSYNRGSKGIVTGAGVNNGGNATNAMGHGGGRSSIVTGASGASGNSGGAGKGQGHGKP